MFLVFVQLGLLPAWMVLIIMLREILITSARLFAASRHMILSAAKEGKHKTVSQFVTIVVILTVLVVREWLGEQALSPVASALRWTVLSCLWVTMILTVISGASFFWRHRVVLLSPQSP